MGSISNIHSGQSGARGLFFVFCFLFIIYKQKLETKKQTKENQHMALTPRGS